MAQMNPAPEFDTAIIGGGFAGLSAAVTLARLGHRVCVIERKPALGGRAYSFSDDATHDLVDNGQHVLMGCYHETLDFLRELGTLDKLVFHEDLEIEMLTGPGRSATLRTARLPGPFHMTGALLRYRHLSITDRLSTMRGGLAMLAMHRRGALEGMTVADLMDRTHQSRAARDCFWYPMAIATLNDTPEVSSAALLAEVLKRAFFSRRRDSAFVYPRLGLSELYCPASIAAVERAGGAVLTRTIAETLELGPDATVDAVRIRDGRRITARRFIAATPPHHLIRILPENLIADKFFARWGDLSTSPIVCVHAWFDREITRSAFVGFVGTRTQWMFNKRRIFEAHGATHPGYLSFVISGAREIVDQPADQILDTVMSDLRAMIPAAREARLTNSIVIKEKQATMAPNPASHRLRPTVATPIANLFLAGDWIQTNLPATIESAVIAGRAAARAAAAI